MTLAVSVEDLRVRLGATGVAAVVVVASCFGHDGMVELRLDDGLLVSARTGTHDLPRPGDRVRLTVRGTAMAYAVDEP